MGNIAPLSDNAAFKKAQRQLDNMAEETEPEEELGNNGEPFAVNQNEDDFGIPR